MNIHPDIMEVTLRDGSYAINFAFTAHDTSVIARALENAGYNWIEVGHGVGLNASAKGHGEAAATDQEYCEAAASSLGKAKYGMFCIPGIARLEDLRMAAECEMGFVRIGTNVTEVEQSAPFIEKAKELGMYVCANFMKSYAVEPKAFAMQVKKSVAFGADCVYLVDSAGGMLPNRVREYFQAVKSECGVKLAFHGHNNTGLAVANSLVAVEEGAAFVDSSLQGLGRSAGNAATELVLAVLLRSGYGLSADLLKTMDVSERYIRPLMGRRGVSSVDLMCGYAEFHSSYMGLVRQASGRYGVDPRELIEEVCKTDKIDCNDEIIAEAASRLKRKSREAWVSQLGLAAYFGHEQS